MRREVWPCRVAAADARACVCRPQDVSICYPQLTVDLSAWWSKVTVGRPPPDFPCMCYLASLQAHERCLSVICALC